MGRLEYGGRAKPNSNEPRNAPEGGSAPGTREVSAQQRQEIDTKESQALLYLSERLPKWKSFVRKTMTQELHSETEPWDILQDSFLLACQHIREFRGRTTAELNSWFRKVLLTMISHQEVHYKRRRGRRVCISVGFLAGGRIDGLPQGEAEPLSNAPSPHELLSSDEELRKILDAIVSLQDLSSRVLLLVDVREMPLGEAAKEMGMTLRAVSSQLWRARQEIRACLRKTESQLSKT